jgi:hypothetical protein
MRRLIGFLLLAFSLPALAGEPVALPFDEAGSLDGAPYRIKVPDNWNGTLLVYARGTQRTVDPVGLNPLAAVPGVPPEISAAQAAALEQSLLSDGYAFAASAFQDDAGVWSIEEGMADTLAITKYFTKRVAKPRRTILWSRSQGTIIGLHYAEHHRGAYDASIAGCAVGAGSPRTWDLTLDLLLAWKTAFGFPPEWGTPGDLRDDILFVRDVVPVIVGHLSDPSKLPRFEFFRIINHLPRAGFYPAPGAPPEASWLLSLMYFATEVRAEVERKAGGAVVQNLDHVYGGESLSEQEKAELAYLESLGVPVDQLVAGMNSIYSKFDADRRARSYNERYAEYSGKIKMPVLTLHTTTDGLVFPSHESAYRDTVDAAGRGDQLVQVFADSVGHCTFTPSQWYEAVTTVDRWLDTGVRPDRASFVEFDPGYEPPAFPNP